MPALDGGPQAVAPARVTPIARTSLQVLDRAIAILALFGGQRADWSGTEVARELDLPVPTAHRFLSALARHHYLHQEETTRRYRLGPAAMSLGARASASLDIRASALPVMRQLTSDTAETSVLTALTPARNASVCLDRVESPQPLRLSVDTGRQLPLHAGASQKALSAFMDDDSIARLLSRPLPKLATNTITDPVKLTNELRKVRAAGVAFSSSETNIDVAGIAIPILNELDGPVCAIGIAGPCARFNESSMPTLIRATQQAARALAVAIGGHAPAWQA